MERESAGNRPARTEKTQTQGDVAEFANDSDSRRARDLASIAERAKGNGTYQDQRPQVGMGGQEETGEEMIERYADAVQYFIDNSKSYVRLDPVLRAFVNSIKRDVEMEDSLVAVQASTP